MRESVSLSADPRDLAAIAARTSLRPDVAVILGTGLSHIADEIADAVEIPYADLPGAPVATSVPGHAARLVLGRVGERCVAAFCGRFHVYQGLSAWQASWPSQLAAGLGAHSIVATNAAGALAPELLPGRIALITDHINLLGETPLCGWPGLGAAGPFVPLHDAYDPGLRALARRVAQEQSLDLGEAVYAAVAGPSYETPAEARMLRMLGADVVGMSTVPETIVARALGRRVLGLSLVTNVAAGPALSHAEVLAAGETARESLSALVIGILSRL